MQRTMIAVVDSIIDLAKSPVGQLAKWLEAHHFGTYSVLDLKEATHLVLISIKEFSEDRAEALIEEFRLAGFTGQVVLAEFPHEPRTRGVTKRPLNDTTCLQLGMNRHDNYAYLSILGIS